ncbi:hypothetical protein F7734_48560 [Scytonema sp. UIC 10036]|uniref:hypothetical protein n=1 Tax=Scytonema sp. UIC 10036 TaxID=2304196 RepID=UPI0012DA7BC7|nr:hypothetical protein [Scytonema sp. UIC 10036]MUG99723.1 hypothetical protein [Scytonema sp. UIC 10036]
MNVKVLSIEPTQEFKTFYVTVVIGEDICQFTMTVETDTIANQNIQILNSDENFLKTFQFNQKLAADISNLVFLVYNHQPIKLPVDMGELSSAA